MFINGIIIMDIKDIKYLKKVLNFAFYTSGTIAGVFSTGYLMNYLAFNKRKQTDVFKKYLDNWGEKSLPDVKLEVIIEDEKIFDNTQNFLFLSNHNSLTDVLAILATAPQSVRFVAKKSIFKIPLFSHAMRYVGMFEIDRNNSSQAIQTLSKAATRLQDGNDSIVMFPEGTRNEGNGLLPFKKGPFHLALESKASIIPVTIINSNKVLPKGSWKMMDGKIKIYYGKPIDTKNLNKNDIDKLMSDVRNEMLKNLEK
jgi:1-acyl-sn-glycerol-3-phosphate acyltransferase